MNRAKPLWLPLAACAEIIVSGDTDLLNLKRFHSIDIVAIDEADAHRAICASTKQNPGYRPLGLFNI